MGQIFIESLNGVNTEVEYLTPDEMMTELEKDILVKVADVMKSNEGFDMKDALIYSLNKGVISEVDYDMVYPTVMETSELVGEYNLLKGLYDSL